MSLKRSHSDVQTVGPMEHSPQSGSAITQQCIAKH